MKHIPEQQWHNSVVSLILSFLSSVACTSAMMPAVGFTRWRHVLFIIMLILFPRHFNSVAALRVALCLWWSLGSNGCGAIRQRVATPPAGPAVHVRDYFCFSGAGGEELVLLLSGRRCQVHVFVLCIT